MSPWRRLIAAAALVVAPSLCLATGPQAQAPGKEEIPESEPFGHLTVDQVERRIGGTNVYVFDGNSPETYALHHLPGAVRMNHKEIKTSVLPKDKNATLIFYCMNEH